MITSSSSLISKMLGMKPATNSPIQSTADKRIYSKWILSLKLVSQRKKERVRFINFATDSYLDCLLRLYFCQQVPHQPPKQDIRGQTVMLGERQ